MKRLLCILLSLCMIIGVCACKKEELPTAQAEKNSKEASITITDHNGDTIILPKKVERIVVCDILPLPSVLSVFFDSAEKIVGMSSSSMSAAQNSILSELYPEILNAKTDFINGSEVNTEELMSLSPDVVFYNASSKELGETLKKAGFNAVAISVNKWDYDCIETLNQWISLLSEIFPDNDRTQKVTSYSNEIYSMVQERVSKLSDKDRARVFFLFQYSDSTLLTSGKLFFGQWWAQSVGAVNVAEELTTDNSVGVNMEQVYSWNPDIVFMTNFTQSQPDDLYNNTVGSYDWSGISAVQNKRVYKMPLGMYRSYTPGVDTPITLLWLAKSVYPELFSDIDITEKVKDYYKEVFGIDLSDEQANSIFAPTSDAGKTDF